MNTDGACPNIPLFRFGGGQDLTTVTLAIISGGLIMDNGEAERTFIYRCQDRFLTYSWLCGWRSLFFVVNEQHAEIYRGAVGALSVRLRRAWHSFGLTQGFPLPEPLFVPLDPVCLQVQMTRDLAQSFRSIAQQQPFQRTVIATNQISPTYVHLLKQLQTALLPYGISMSDLHEDKSAGDLARLAMMMHDKANYVALSERLGASVLAAHVPTIVLAENDIQNIHTWDELVLPLDRSTGQASSKSIYVKASRYSAGNLSVRISRENFDVRWAAYQAEVARELMSSAEDLETSVRELRAEIRMAPCLRGVEFTDETLRCFKGVQTQLRQHPRFLVQPELRSAAGARARYNGIGITYSIGAAGGLHIATYAHIFRDPDHKHFLGAYLADDVRSAINGDLFEALRQLCLEMARMGYRGPVNFDSRISPDGRYRLIYDCNPRMSGVFPSMAIARALRSQGCEIVSVLTLGYRGELRLADASGMFARLTTAGILWSPVSSRGAIMLPNLCRDDGYDLHLVNIDLPVAQALLAPGGILSEHFRGDVPALYH